MLQESSAVFVYLYVRFVLKLNIPSSDCLCTRDGQICTEVLINETKRQKTKLQKNNTFCAKLFYFIVFHGKTKWSKTIPDFTEIFSWFLRRRNWLYNALLTCAAAFFFAFLTSQKDKRCVWSASYFLLINDILHEHTKEICGNLVRTVAFIIVSFSHIWLTHLCKRRTINSLLLQFYFSTLLHIVHVKKLAIQSLLLIKQLFFKLNNYFCSETELLYKNLYFFIVLCHFK